MLKPESFRAANGTTLKAQDDGSILASGAVPDVETYTVTVKTNLKNITAFRLEALTDPSLPKNGPGTATDGNFILSEFKVAARAGQDLPRPVRFASVESDYSAPYSDVNLMVDDDAATGMGANDGWNISGAAGIAHAADFELSMPLRAGVDTVLVFTIESRSTRSPKHHLGRLRLLATSKQDPTAAGALPPAVVEAVALPAAQRTAEQQQRVADAHRQAAPPTSRPVHGLVGRYYDTFRNGLAPKFNYDEFTIPSANPGMVPAEKRVDAQIAFGKGRGFAHKPWGFGESEWGGAVVWKGYIHLPKAGTYQVLSASHPTSAVYINGCRVALNGHYGGTIVSDAFGYAEDTGAGNAYDGPNGQYALPFTVAASRVLPIEVRYRHKGEPRLGPGIDLYWVTPDSLKGADGKPIAQLVPPEALYVDLPEGQELEAPLASAAHCSISSDRLYLYDGGPAATLTIRIADKNGRGLPGRRTHVHHTSSYSRAVFDQPAQATDENGETKILVKPAASLGTSTFYATDLTDLVSVPQVCLMYGGAVAYSFLPHGSSPYYDGDGFKVSPTPMVVGKPVMITVPLENRRETPASVYVTVGANVPNIGATDWGYLGQSEPMILKPREYREAKVVFTPTREHGHVCFKMTVWAKFLDQQAARAGRIHTLAMVDQPRIVLALQGTSEGGGAGFDYAPAESRQQNIGPVVAAAPSGLDARGPGSGGAAGGPTAPQEQEPEPPADCEFQIFGDDHPFYNDRVSGPYGDDEPGHTNSCSAVARFHACRCSAALRRDHPCNDGLGSRPTARGGSTE